MGLLRNALYLRVYKIVFQTQDAKGYFGHKISAKGIIIGNPLSENLPKPYTGSRDKTLGTGVPCICTDCPIGGAKPYIKSMENGILVPVGDTEAFTKAVLKVIRDEQLQKTFTKNAVQIIDCLSLNNILKCWIELI